MENHYIDTIKKMSNLFAVEIPTWNVNLNVEIKDGQEMQFKEMPTFPSRSVLGRMKNNISCNCNFNGILLFSSYGDSKNHCNHSWAQSENMLP